MSPIKFENHIKERLESRSITPSKNSWEKLSARLNEKKPFPFQKLLIAASLIGILVTILLTFNKENKPVEFTKTSIDSILKKEISNDKVITSLDISEVDKETTTDTETNIRKTNTPQKIAKKEVKSNTEFKELIVAKVVNTVLEKKDSIFKNSESIAIPDSIQLKNEVEQLLTNAKIKIALENIKDSSTIVNHNSLLEEAEIELEIDNTLKNKIYKAIVVNYNKLSKPKKVQN